uniref:LOW QUALITY PROTEIN: ankyrin repeat domain-containing protein 7 n=1 Tax=Macaca mulatta TaxID=9544 RepID=UPI0010A237FB|nr:LOW QUALITY PROTEIN: ankyrin repeat domain-containing protein 7 [Macaca mulatta]
MQVCEPLGPDHNDLNSHNDHNCHNGRLRKALPAFPLSSGTGESRWPGARAEWQGGRLGGQGTSWSDGKTAACTAMNKLFSFWKRKNETRSRTSSDPSIGQGYSLREKDLKKLHRAASVGDLKKLKEYLQLKKYDVNMQDKKYRTPLHLACANGHRDVVLFLIEQQCKINIRDSENKSPLIKAVQCQNEDCATILLNCGADPNLRDVRYNTALHYAVCGQSFSLVEQLLDYEADLEAKNKDGYTPLLVAVINNNPKMVKFLLEKGADVNASDNYQRTALILAVSGEPTRLVKLLLQQGVELSCRDIVDSQLRNMLISMVLLYIHNSLQVMERRNMLNRHLILGTACD